MLQAVDSNVERDEVFVRDDFLARALAAAIMARALTMAAHSQTNRVHRLQRGDLAGATPREELSGKMVFDCMKWPGGWMLAPRPEPTMRAGIYTDHQATLEKAMDLVTMDKLMKDLPRLVLKKNGADENFEATVHFA